MIERHSTNHRNKDQRTNNLLRFRKDRETTHTHEQKNNTKEEKKQFDLKPKKLLVYGARTHTKTPSSKIVSHLTWMDGG